MNRSGIFPTASRGRVLFVEEDEDLLVLYAGLAEALAVTSILAHRFEHGLAKARLHRPDVVVVDVGRRPSASRALVRVWRAVAVGASIVAVTTDGRATVDALRELGFDDVLVKPFALTRFDDVVTRAIDRARRRPALRVVV